VSKDVSDWYDMISCHAWQRSKIQTVPKVTRSGNGNGNVVLAFPRSVSTLSSFQFVTAAIDNTLECNMNLTITFSTPAPISLQRRRYKGSDSSADAPDSDSDGPKGGGSDASITLCKASMKLSAFMGLFAWTALYWFSGI
jgi:hypothetical protein